METDLNHVRELTQKQGADLSFVANHSGGKDSLRRLGFVRRKFPDSPVHALMADKGFEYKRPISAADFARQRCAEFGLELTVVQPEAHIRRDG